MNTPGTRVCRLIAAVFSESLSKMLDRKQASPIRSPCQLPINRSGINPPKVDKIGATTERCQAAWLALRKRECFYRQRINLSGELGNSSSPSRAEGLNLTRTMNRRHTDRSCDSHEDLNGTELISAVCFFLCFPARSSRV